ncbi:MAG: hypothetical protein HQL10_01120 [Nitrospirae bacterium]|nr:hypothetical protein [Nitrospirota bacterium]
MKAEDYKKELVTTLFAKKKLISEITLFVFVCSILIAFFWPPTYGSYGSVLVKVKKPVKSPEAVEEATIRYDSITKEDLNSEMTMLTSPDVIQRAINYLKEQGKYEPPKQPVPVIDDIKEAVSLIKDKLTILLSDRKEKLNKEVYKMKESIKTEMIPNSNVIEVTFFHVDEKFAVRFLDALFQQYITYRMEIYYPEEAKKFFSDQKGDLSGELEGKRKDWINVVEKHRIADPLKEIENNLLVKKELETQLNALNNLAIEKKHYIEYLDNALASKDVQFFSFIDKLAITNLSNSLQQIYLEYGKVIRTYKPASDKAKPVEKQMNDALALLRGEVQSYRNSIAKELAGINKKIEYIKSTIKEINDRNVELQKQNIDTQKIAIEMNLLKHSYETFSKRKDEAVHGELSPTNSYLSILRKPFPSDGPIFPKKRIVIPLGLIIGFILGCSFAFISEYLDHTFKKISDVERMMGLSVIFSIPDFQEPVKKKKPAAATVGAAALAFSSSCLLLGSFMYYEPDVSLLRIEAEKSVNIITAEAKKYFYSKNIEAPLVVGRNEPVKSAPNGQTENAVPSYSSLIGAGGQQQGNGIIVVSQ